MKVYFVMSVLSQKRSEQNALDNFGGKQHHVSCIQIIWL